ncbi:unnamed protein product [Fraxinus pennsylvanica]|uniref:Uncharacterized protein n=1 Tax=Fraxinus pennsylvanica TaxID=56036 RepID=A0AAD2EAD9_9LAMI|nr:unnamed protein product [Fraxinus pennsylvanica]
MVGKSPGRRSKPSPIRARSGPVTRRNSPSVPGRRESRDGGESSHRRSLSPVTRTYTGPDKIGLTQNQLVRRTGKSPGQLPPAALKLPWPDVEDLFLRKLH